MPDTWKTLIAWIATVASGLLRAFITVALSGYSPEYPSNDFRTEVAGWRHRPTLRDSADSFSQFLLLALSLGVRKLPLSSRG
ncbi:hypothetical protein C7S18_02180 [Ahniella affigens]|uniref:Uncharacterized protein n=1 Tax=Ahniella affigens TaxID=2021234 RepID=A0A2P1PMK5_9GAMM|nr:hypothetical protein [Ahniella affigens]AVP96071.1 hypothetical protein C7S18_02180 [Ahniella affigens]